MDRERIEALQRTAMFGALDDAAVALLLGRARSRRVAAGDAFFEQGEPGRSTFLLEQGRAAVVKHWEGSEHLLRHLVAGDCFGEVALLDFGPRSATVRAETDCEAIELGAADLRALAREAPEQFALVYMNLGRELGRRLRDADERLFRSRVASRSEPPAAGYDFATL